LPGFRTNDGTLAMQFHVPLNIELGTYGKIGLVKPDRLRAGLIGDFLRERELFVCSSVLEVDKHPRLRIMASQVEV
jgi:hypothetical protein